MPFYIVSPWTVHKSLEGSALIIAFNYMGDYIISVRRFAMASMASLNIAGQLLSISFHGAFKNLL